MSCGVGHRHGYDLELLWLCCRQAATALIGLLAWEAPYATDVALKNKQKTSVHWNSAIIPPHPQLSRFAVKFEDVAAGSHVYELVNSSLTRKKIFLMWSHQGLDQISTFYPYPGQP